MNRKCDTEQRVFLYQFRLVVYYVFGQVTYGSDCILVVVVDPMSKRGIPKPIVVEENLK